MGYYWLVASVAGLFMACSSGNRHLETALVLAGQNRAELQKVLDKYRGRDEEKYRAACFLIENMPFYGTYEGKALENYRKYFVGLSAFDRSRPAKELVDSLRAADGDFSKALLAYRCDAGRVDSAFLVGHIEWAFKVWREQPWGKYVGFDDFCEYVLPYRIGDEPLSRWREALYERYNPMLDEFRQSADSVEVLKAAQILMDTLRKDYYRYTGQFPEGPHLGPEVLEWKVGSCREFADAMIYVFRAVGIPCGTDRMMQRGDTNAAHFWNFIVGRGRASYMTEFPYQEKWKEVEDFGIAKGKVYRVTYSMNREMTEKGREVLIYPAFRHPFFYDVTAEYSGGRNRTVVVPESRLYRKVRKDEAVYLCFANWQQWLPVAYTFLADGKVRFDDVKGGVAGVLATWDGAEFECISDPFTVGSDTDDVRFLTPEKKLHTVNLYRKFYMAVKGYLYSRMIGGVIEGSNREDFEETDTLFMVREAPYRRYTVAYLKPDKAYRYMRYRGGKDSYCNIAELAFYRSAQDTLPLRGRVMGTPGYYGDDGSNRGYANVFDGNTETSFDYKFPDTGWAGMDFGRPVRVEKAVYTPRNDVNFIYGGNDYELFYWGRGRWNSVGMQQAESDSLVYSVPQNALLYLRNHTAGKDERIFEYRDGKQIFW